MKLDLLGNVLRISIVGTLAAIATLISLTDSALGDDHGGGHGHHGGHGHYGGYGHGGYGHGGHGYGGHGYGGYYRGYSGYYGGNSYFRFSPYGFGYGYQNGNFGLQIGSYLPLAYGYGSYGGYGYGDYGYGGYGGYPGSAIQFVPYSYNTAYYSPVFQPTLISPSVMTERPLYAVESPLDAPAPVVQAVALQVSSASTVESNEQATPFQIEAEKAFRAKDYQRAVRLNGHALIEDRENAQLHLFASQCLFALEDYRSAAIAITEAMSLSETKDWGFVVENFRKFYTDDAYVKQMARLVEFNKENPDAGYGFALRGYHYLFLGHRDAAKLQLSKAVKIQSEDPIAQKLLDLIDGKQPAATPQNR